MIILSFVLTSCLLIAGNLEVEKAAIKAAALNYLEGWYEGKVERMDKALHEKLLKRAFFKNPRTGKEVYREADKTKMMDYTKMGPGKNVPKEKWGIKVKILDIYNNIATVKTVCLQYIDYLHLVKEKGEWKIINVLWQLNLENLPKPKSGK